MRTALRYGAKTHRRSDETSGAVTRVDGLTREVIEEVRSAIEVPRERAHVHFKGTRDTGTTTRLCTAYA